MKFPNLDKKEFNSNFRKPVFLRLYQGMHIVRFLGPEIHEEQSHYLPFQKATIQCPEENCPVCDNNRMLRAENPDKKTNDIPGYSPKRTVYYVNVLDRTPVKKCTECGASVNSVNGTFTPVCPSCQTSIIEINPEPSNEIKVFSRGVEFFGLLQLVQQTTLGKDGEPLELENFDIQLLVPRNKQPVPSAMVNNTDTVDYNEEDLFDLSEVIIKLEPEEITQFLKGISLKDIFTSRSTSFFEEATEEEVADTTNEIKDTINKAKQLFD